jgi:hypothetical protein
VPVAMAAIAAGVARSTDLRKAITASDNAAAERLWAGLGGGHLAAAAATAQLRAAGERRTDVQSRRVRPGYSAIGQTNWALVDQARFTAGMACSPAGARVLRLMGAVVDEQRWGLGLPGRGAQFKGGWGPGVTPGTADGWLDRQMGVLKIRGRRVAVTLLTDAGDHATGTRNLTSLARWVTSHANTAGLPPTTGC